MKLKKIAEWSLQILLIDVYYTQKGAMYYGTERLQTTVDR